MGVRIPGSVKVRLKSENNTSTPSLWQELNFAETCGSFRKAGEVTVG